MAGKRNFGRKGLAGLPGIGKAASHLHVVHLTSPKVNQFWRSRSLVDCCRDKDRRENDRTHDTEDQRFHPGLVLFKGMRHEFTDHAAWFGRSYLSGGLHESSCLRLTRW